MLYSNVSGSRAKESFSYVSSIDDENNHWAREEILKCLNYMVIAATATPEKAAHFTARDFVGGNNSENWHLLPLRHLYNHHLLRLGGKGYEVEANAAAGKDVGKILKRVLCQSDIEFEIIGEEGANVYRRISHLR